MVGVMNKQLLYSVNTEAKTEEEQEKYLLDNYRELNRLALQYEAARKESLKNEKLSKGCD
jgi:hypothetical protein